ncbi:MAG: hypothetical protein Kow0092_26460 [Deferrisomatales bacterium]
MTRWAAADLGTNTFRLLVAEERRPGVLVSLELRQKVVRLGEGLAEGGRVLPRAAARAETLLREFRARLDALGVERRLAVLAAAGRKAADGPAFAARVAEWLGARVRIVDGEEEARLSARGAWSLARPARPEALFLDIGGGSTEIAAVRGGSVRAAASLPVGVVALHEVVRPADPPGARDLSRFAAAASEALGALPGPLQPASWREAFRAGVACLVATAGTPLTAAAEYLGRPVADTRALTGVRVPGWALERIWERFTAMTCAERARRPSVEAGREDVIVAGLALLREVVQGAGAGEVVVSDGGLAEGELLRAVEAERGAARWMSEGEAPGG